MKKEHVKLLACPACHSQLEATTEEEADSGSITTGKLHCQECNKSYPIIRSIPRFVNLDNYASGFGLQWNKHAKTQYDSRTGINISGKRFFEETKWAKDLTGEVVLEVGSGSGRFTEQAASTNATVVSLDYSFAVDANYASNGNKDNVLIVQGDIYNMPFYENFFDKIVCIGVLQHTPDVHKSFSSLPPFLKSGGSIAVDVYRKSVWFKQMLRTKYWARPFTKNIEPEKLYKLIHSYISFMWGLASLINKLPYGRWINLALLVVDYRGIYNLDEKLLKEWAVLDTFDMLSPAYDSPQTIATMQQWFAESEMINIEVHNGHNGIEARGIKP